MLLELLPKDRAFWRWMGLAALFHAIAAVLSGGFYHTDEHFQILEFMMQRLGYSSASDLPIEFERQMRPWLMPAIFTAMTVAWKAIGVASPFVWAASYRLLSALLGWLSIVGLGACADAWIEDRRWRDWTLAALALIWYFPAFHARHSSESWSGSLFFIGISLLVLWRRRRLTAGPALAVGMLFGLAFECRYQVGIMIAGALAWLALFGRPADERRSDGRDLGARIRELTWIAGGIAGAVALGTLANRWGYRTWVFAPWNYVQFNLIEGHVGDVDTSPFWDFFRRAATESWPLLGVALLGSFVVAWARWPRHLLTWATAPFFLVHAVIGHKELRFLFPIASAGPLLLAMALHGPSGKLAWERFHGLRRWRWPARFAYALNGLGLLALSVVPAWMPVRFYAGLRDLSRIGLTIHYKDFDPYNVLGIPMTFYRPTELSEVRIDRFEEIADKVRERGATPERPIWLFHNASHLPPAAQALEPLCHPELRTLPDWVSALPFTQRMSNWTLYRCYEAP